MTSDIVFPFNNEKEFIAMAEKLGYTSLIFAYTKQKEKTLYQNTKINIKHAFISNQKSPKTKNILISKNPANLRTVLDHTKPDYITGIEWDDKPDSMHSRNSHLNQVLCKIMNKNNIALLIPLQDIQNSKGLKKSIILGRISQNTRLCKKYKVKVKLATFATSPYHMRSPRDLQSLAIILGLSTEQAKNSLKQ
tara:strand:- start:1832 stop:2410 length:579 start_codon:yes stop_codon:yes gene_type:complete